MAAGLEERNIPAPRGGKWSAVRARLLEAAAVPFDGSAAGRHAANDLRRSTDVSYRAENIPSAIYEAENPPNEAGVCAEAQTDGKAEFFILFCGVKTSDE